MKVIYNSEQNLFIPSDDNILLPQIMWHITDRCMLNCKMCFSKGSFFNHTDINQKTIEDNLNLLSSFQVQKIDISGGEPLLFTNLDFLVKNAITKGFHLTITTRGLGSRKNIDWITSNWNLFSRIIISLDSYDKFSNDLYVGYHGAFDSLIEFINNLKSTGCNNMRINTVVNRTLLDLNKLNKICKLVKDIMPKEWCLIQPHPLNKLKSFSDYSVSQEEFSMFADQVKRTIGDYSNINILSRSNDTYSTYWCLYPDNTIARLSTGESYSFKCKLTQQNMTKIEKEIRSNIQLLP